MHKLFYLFYILYWPIFLCSQNLVPNSGFDYVIECPYDVDQVHFAEPWYNPSNGPSIIYNACSTTERFSVPNAGVSILSYMEPRSGDGYAYLRPYRSNVVGLITYLGVPLFSSLEKDENYYIELFVRPDYLFSQDIIGFSDAFGLAFTDDYYYEEIEPNGSLSLEPVIENRGRVIDDIQNWTKISGCYKAEGWEAHAILGNFRSTDETLFETNRPDVNGHDVFWYIEDVLIQKFNPLPDVAYLCSTQDSLEFSLEHYGNEYSLNSNLINPTFTIDDPGTYILEVSFDNCTLSDTMIVYDFNQLIQEQRDTTIEKCEEIDIKLDFELPGESILWNTGDTTNSIEVNKEGIYEATVSTQCGKLKSTYLVENKSCDCSIYIPNAFTPNSDGINDLLEVFVACEYPINYMDLQVYDRWGNQMFESTDVQTNKWDGTVRGKPVDSGSFLWYLEYEVDIDGKVEKKQKTGSVQILK